MPRYDHTTTLLDTGEVLAAAGRRLVTGEPVSLLRSAELYDPISESWSPSGALQDARWSHTATLLRDGTVLVAGGSAIPTSPGPTRSRCWPVPRSAEIYDPATGTWAPTGPLTIRRHTTSAVVLQTGEVLIPAGFTPLGNGTTADRYDASAVASTATGPLNVGRARQGAMLLDDGRVLVAAGFGAGATSELYDPETDTWSLTGNLASGRFNFSFTVLPDGRALVAGGAVPGVGVVDTAEIYDPATSQWSPADDLNEAHGSSSSLSNSQAAIVLPSDPWSFEADPAVCGANCGKVLVVGNSATGSAELYDPAVSLEIDETVASDGTRGQVRGSLTCPAGEVFVVDVVITQGESTGQGTTRGTCTGSPLSRTPPASPPVSGPRSPTGRRRPESLSELLPGGPARPPTTSRSARRSSSRSDQDLNRAQDANDPPEP